VDTSVENQEKNETKSDKKVIFDRMCAMQTLIITKKKSDNNSSSCDTF